MQAADSFASHAPPGMCSNRPCQCALASPAAGRCWRAVPGKACFCGCRVGEVLLVCVRWVGAGPALSKVTLSDLPRPTERRAEAAPPPGLFPHRDCSLSVGTPAPGRRLPPGAAFCSGGSPCPEQLPPALVRPTGPDRGDRPPYLLGGCAGQGPPGQRQGLERPQALGKSGQ